MLKSWNPHSDFYCVPKKKFCTFLFSASENTSVGFGDILLTAANSPLRQKYHLKPMKDSHQMYHQYSLWKCTLAGVGSDVMDSPERLVLNCMETLLELLSAFCVVLDRKKLSCYFLPSCPNTEPCFCLLEDWTVCCGVHWFPPYPLEDAFNWLWKY